MHFLPSWASLFVNLGVEGVLGVGEGAHDLEGSFQSNILILNKQVKRLEHGMRSEPQRLLVPIGRLEGQLGPSATCLAAAGASVSYSKCL